MRALRRAADNVIREKGKAKEARGARVSVTRLTDSQERVITAARGAVRGEQRLFSPATPSSRSVLGWVVSFIRVGKPRVCACPSTSTNSCSRITRRSADPTPLRPNLRLPISRYVRKITREQRRFPRRLGERIRSGGKGNFSGRFGTKNPTEATAARSGCCRSSG